MRTVDGGMRLRGFRLASGEAWAFAKRALQGEWAYARTTTEPANERGVEEAMASMVRGLEEQFRKCSERFVKGLEEQFRKCSERFVKGPRFEKKRIFA